MEDGRKTGNTCEVFAINAAFKTGYGSIFPSALNFPSLFLNHDHLS